MAPGPSAAGGRGSLTGAFLRAGFPGTKSLTCFLGLPATGRPPGRFVYLRAMTFSTSATMCSGVRPKRSAR